MFFNYGQEPILGFISVELGVFYWVWRSHKWKRAEIEMELEWKILGEKLIKNQNWKKYYSFICFNDIFDILIFSESIKEYLIKNTINILSEEDYNKLGEY